MKHKQTFIKLQFFTSKFRFEEIKGAIFSQCSLTPDAGVTTEDYGMSLDGSTGISIVRDESSVWNMRRNNPFVN